MSNDPNNLDDPKELTTKQAAFMDRAAGMEIATVDGGNTLVIESMAQVIEFSGLMARAGGAVPPHLRENQGACLAIVMQALHWSMDPFQVANKSYFVNDRVAFEAQMIVAVINRSPALDGRPRCEFSGEGAKRVCIVTGTLAGETEPRIYESPPLDTVKGKSPLWVKDPDQQLWYYAARAWARRWVPDVIMGAYSPDELGERPPRGSQAAATPRPTEASMGAIAHIDGHAGIVRPDDPEPMTFDLVDPWGEVIEQTLENADWLSQFYWRLAKRLWSLADRNQFVDNNLATALEIATHAPTEGFTMAKFMARVGELGYPFAAESEAAEPEPERQEGDEGFDTQLDPDPAESEPVTVYYEKLKGLIPECENLEAVMLMIKHRDQAMIAAMTPNHQAELDELWEAGKRRFGFAT